jgi:hypothetical protein
MKLGKASRLRTLIASGLPIRWFRSSFRSHTRTTSQRMAPYAGAKLAYISLNIPTACPPRTAVSVNRPFCNRRRCWVTFGHELDQICDLPNDVAANHNGLNFRFPRFGTHFPKVETFIRCQTRPAAFSAGERAGAGRESG